MSTPQSQQELRQSVHLKMLAKSRNAVDLGEFTVVPLRFAVSIAVGLITAHDKKLLAEVRERVVGDILAGHANDTPKDISGGEQTMYWKGRTELLLELSAEQRKKLDAIEGEI